MKWLIINTESFSPGGLKQRVDNSLPDFPSYFSPRKPKKRKKAVEFSDLPLVVQMFLSVFPMPFIILDEASKIKTNTAMNENDKSTRTRLIKLLNKFGHRCIMTGTLMSKSPLNVVDPYNFLQEDYFPETMWHLAERYCILTTLHTARGRRVLISQKDYARVRGRLKRAYAQGGERRLTAEKEYVLADFGISYTKQEHIIQHQRYTPFINVDELMSRIAGDTVFVKRKDVFDITFDRFVNEPIMRPVKLSAEAKKLANDLIKIGFTNNLVLGRAPALELLIRLQDVCNGFEPVKDEAGQVSYIPLRQNAKIEEMLKLLDEIGTEDNQVVVWSSRRALLGAICEALKDRGTPYVRYDGGTADKEKEEAERRFGSGDARVFVANQASGAFGLNGLGGSGYMIWMCVDDSVEKYHQARSRILRGQLKEPKFAYAVYAEGSVEERQWETLRVGLELLSAENRKETFEFV